MLGSSRENHQGTNYFRVPTPTPPPFLGETWSKLRITPGSWLSFFEDGPKHLESKGGPLSGPQLKMDQNGNPKRSDPVASAVSRLRDRSCLAAGWPACRHRSWSHAPAHKNTMEPYPFGTRCPENDPNQDTQKKSGSMLIGRVT